jgi:general secretion pathway protein L
LERGGHIRLPTREEFRSGLEAFVRWWAAELWACLPVRWQDRLRHRNLQFLVTVRDDAKRIVVVERNSARPSRTFALTPANDQEAASLAEIRRAIRKQGARFDLLVPEESIARRRMKVPLAAKNDLRDALKLELDRFTRFEHADVYLDHSVVETDHEARTITIDVAIVPRAVVDGLVTALRGAGLKASGAHLWREGTKFPEATFFSLNTGPSAKTVRMVTHALIVLVMALDVAAAYVPLWLKIDTLNDLQARIETIRPKVERALQLEHALTELRSKDAYLINLKNQAPSMSEVLGDVARVLPESAWLEQLQVREGRIQLEGFAGAPAELGATLDASPILSDVRFEWPVTADASANADRFDISARLERPDRSRQ